ncbi:MAG: LysR family transcriptional regulator [Congregibacter sp.]
MAEHAGQQALQQDMNFRRISHFLHVAELGNLSRAAERLNIVQPALSQSIRLLEEDLGVVLFNRSRRGMELTEAGRLFMESAYGILNQYNRARENISAIGDNPKGLVSVAMTASALHVLTVPLCRSLKSTYPGIELNLVEGLAGSIHQGFEAGLYDLVISYMVQPGDRVHCEDLIEEELFLTSKYDPDLQCNDVTFKSLAKHRLIIPPDQHGVRGMVNDIADAQNIEMSLESITAALHPTLALVEDGVGESLLPWAAIYDRVDDKKLSARRIIRPRITHKVSMIYPSHRPLTQATIAVMDTIRQAVRKVHEEGRWPGELLLAATG